MNSRNSFFNLLILTLVSRYFDFLILPYSFTILTESGEYSEKSSLAIGDSILLHNALLSLSGSPVLAADSTLFLAAVLLSKSPLTDIRIFDRLFLAATSFFFAYISLDRVSVCLTLHLGLDLSTGLASVV